MNNLIDIVEQHTNNETAEGIAEAGLITAIITAVIYCLALLA